jgi:Na+/H+ antiporter NhaA
VFLSTLAVADDIIAILVIAIFYGESPDLLWLGAAAIVFVALIVMNRMHVYSLVPYILVGCVLWFCVFSSGIHSTIAGVLLAFAIPSGSRVNLDNFFDWSNKRLRMANSFYEGDETPLVAQKDYITTVSSLSKISKQAVPPATRLEHKLYPWVYFLILPLFALTNADVAVTGVPDERWGESLAAFVVLEPGASVTEQDIQDYCTLQLGGFKKPRRVIFVDDLKRLVSGKVPKERLDELIALLKEDSPD